MLSDKIKLTAKDILEKDFKTAMRGYKPEDVDQFLDLIIKDYEVFHQEIEDLKQENVKLKKLAESQGCTSCSTNYNSNSRNDKL